MTCIYLLSYHFTSPLRAPYELRDLQLQSKIIDCVDYQQLWTPIKHPFPRKLTLSRSIKLTSRRYASKEMSKLFSNGVRYNPGVPA
jgi:hypothetical protein